MAYKLQLKRGASGALPTGSAGEPLFTTDTNDLYIGTGASNQRYQKYIASGTSSQFLKGDGSLDSNTYYLASNPSAYIALTALTASAPLSYNNTTGAFTISQASGSVNGFLSSTDWTTFNNKQNTITNPVTGTGTTNYLPKWTSGSAIGNSLVYDNGTNVGIGTASPGAKFELYDATNSFAYVRTASQILKLSASTTKVDIDNIAGDPISFSIGGSESMRITSSGNLLVNSTTDNGNRLQVTGNGYFSGDLGIGIVSPLTVTNYRSLDIRGTTGGLIEMGNTSNQITGRFIEIEATSSIAKFMAFNSVPLVLGTQGVERMRIDTSGNLGLGVTPSAWSGVGKSIELQNSAFITAQGQYLYIGSNFYYNGINYIRKVTERATQYAQQLGRHEWYTSAYDSAGTAITFTQAMTLTSGGNLLVGTTTDSGEKLQVAGSARIISTIAGNFTSLLLSNASSANNARNILQFSNDVGAAGLIDIFSSTWSATGGGDDVANGMRILGQGDGGLSLRAQNGSLRFYTGSTERLVIKSNGIVNISNVPSSATGLSAGDIYKDASGFLKIV